MRVGDRKNITLWPRARHPAEVFLQISQASSSHLSTTMERWGWRGGEGGGNPCTQKTTPAKFTQM